MATSAGNINVKLTMDTSDYQKGAKGAGTSTDKMSKGFAKGAMKAGVIGAAIVIAAKALKVLVKVTKESITAFIKQEKVEAQLNAVLKSTAGISGMTAKSIKNLANELSMVSTFGDDAIIASSNLLLTFTKIGEETFPRAQTAVLDMATALRTDLKSASIQLGKALNDPVKGMAAMSRSGVSFTQAQKDMVKSMMANNDILGAQNVILAEMEVQFKGAALAASLTFGGQMEVIKNQLGDVKENFGELFKEMAINFLPVIKQLVIDFKEWTTTLKEDEGFKAFIAQLNKMAATAKQYLPTIEKTFLMIASAIKEVALDQLIITFQMFGELFEGLDIGPMDLIIGQLIQLAIMMKVLGGVISTVTTFSVGTLTLLLQVYRDLGLIVSELPGTFLVVFTAIKNYIINSFADAKDNVLAFFKGMVDSMKNLGKNLVKILAGKLTFAEVFEAAFSDVKTVTAQTAEQIAEDFKTANQVITDALGDSEAMAAFEERVKNMAGNAAVSVVQLAADIGLIWADLSDETKALFIQLKKDINETIEDTNKNIVTDTINTTMSLEEAYMDRGKKILESMIRQKEAIAFHEEEARVAAKEAAKEALDDAIASSTQMLSIATNVMGSIQDTFSSMMASQTDEVNDSFNKQQLLLDDKLEKGLISQAHFDKESEKLEKDRAKKLYAIKKKEFEVQKGMDIAQVWIDAASAVLSTWAGYASMGIPGTIMAGIQTASILAIAGVQTGVIASKQAPSPPAFRTGGTVGNTTIRMNEDGGEIATMPDGTVIIPNDISKNIADATGKVNNINVNFAGAYIDSKMNLDKMANVMIKKLGRKLALN